MGFSSLGVVMGIISQVHFIDFRINQLYNSKFSLSRWSMKMGNYRSRAFQQPMDNTNPITRGIREFYFDNTGGHYKTLNGNEFDLRDANMEVSGPMNAKQVEAWVEGKQQEMKTAEVAIDQELEQWKAQRTALESQKQEFQKYISDGIKSTFKNNYA